MPRIRLSDSGCGSNCEPLSQVDGPTTERPEPLAAATEVIAESWRVFAKAADEIAAWANILEHAA
jgi:hypothetical protein